MPTPVSGQVTAPSGLSVTAAGQPGPHPRVVGVGPDAVETGGPVGLVETTGADGGPVSGRAGVPGSAVLDASVDGAGAVEEGLPSDWFCWTVVRAVPEGAVDEGTVDARLLSVWVG